MEMSNVTGDNSDWSDNINRFSSIKGYNFNNKVIYYYNITNHYYYLFYVSNSNTSKGNQWTSSDACSKL